LLVKEKWAIVLTANARVCYRHGLDAAVVSARVPFHPDVARVRDGLAVVLGLD